MAKFLQTKFVLIFLFSDIICEILHLPSNYDDSHREFLYGSPGTPESAHNPNDPVAVLAGEMQSGPPSLSLSPIAWEMKLFENRVKAYLRTVDCVVGNISLKVETLSRLVGENQIYIEPVKQWFQVLTNLATGWTNDGVLPAPRQYPQFPVLKDGRVIDAQDLLKGMPGVPGMPGLPGPIGPKGRKGDVGYEGRNGSPCVCPPIIDYGGIPGYDPCRCPTG